MSTWVGHYAHLELVCLWTKVHQISFHQRGRVCGWTSFFSRCSICRSIPEIFAIKVESFQKILGADLPKIVPTLSPSLAALGLEKFREGSPTSRVLIAPLNFRPNFKFLQINLSWGTPVHVVVCAMYLAQTLACVKIWDGSTPNGRNVVSRKMSTWVAQYAPLELFCLWTKVHQISFVQRRRVCGWTSFFQMFDM